MEILIKQLRLVITNTIVKAGKVRQLIFLKFLCQMNLEENVRGLGVRSVRFLQILRSNWRFDLDSRLLYLII